MEIGNRLKNVLIKNNTLIAKELLKLENNEDKFINGVGYLDIAIANPSNLSYVLVDRIDRFKYQKSIENILSDLHRSCRFTVIQNWYLAPTEGRGYYLNKGQIAKKIPGLINSVRVRKNNKFIDVPTYAGGFLSIADDNCYSYDFFNDQKRLKFAFMCKAGKLIRKLFSDKFNDKDIQDFVISFINLNDPLTHRNLEFKEVSGNEIKHYYHEDNNINGGTLGSSCMRYSGCQKFLDIYTENINDIKLLVLINGDGLAIGRALIWNNIPVHEEKYTLMDRIYVSNSNDEAIFISYAICNGYMYKKSQSMTVYDFILPDGSIHDDLDISISLENMDFNHYPYVDTFHYINHDRTELSTIDGDVELSDYENGTPFEENHEDERYCEFDDEWYSDDDVYLCEVSDDYIHYENSCHIEDLDYYVHERFIDDIKYFNINRTYFSSDVVVCCIDDEYIHEDDATYSEFHDGYINSDDAISYGDDYYIQSDMVESEYHGYDIPEHLSIKCEETEDYVLEDEYDEYLESIKEEEMA